MQSLFRASACRRLTAAFLPLTAACLGLTTAALTLPAHAAPPGGLPRPDDVPVRGLIHRLLTTPAPTGADAIRLTVLGDGSGGQLQVRLLSGKEDGVLSGYCAAPSIPIDFKGWKTLILPLSQFTFHSDNDPEVDQDGVADARALGTATAIQLAVVGTSVRIFVDDLAWTTATAAPTDAPLAMIDDFENTAVTPTDWIADGDFEEIRSVVISGNHIASYVKSGTGSLQFTVRALGEDQAQLYGPTLDARLKRIPKQPYVLFARPPFETVTPDTTPTPREVAGAAAATGVTINCFAAPGQSEPATFAVYSSLPITGATVALRGPLVSKTLGRLPASAIDIHVVRPSYAVDGPQLLIKDDREALTGPLPKVRLTGVPITNIAEHTTKQFWITVRVPAEQAPGIYTGKVVFQAPGIKPAAVTLSVEVVPVILRTPHYQYGIDLMSVLSGDGAAPGEQAVTPDMLKAQLTDIRSHGFKMVTLHDKPANLPAALQAYKDAGLSTVGPVVIASPLQAADFATVVALRQSLGLSPDFDIYYRMSADQAANPDAARAYAQAAHAADKSALVVATVPSETVYGGLSTTLSDRLAPMYTLASDHAATLMATGKRATPNRDWWTWSIGQNDPIRNRLYSGFLLFKTGNGLYGAFPGPYEFAPAGVDPFGIFTLPTDGPGMTGGSVGIAPPVQMATYPVEGGVLDTVQWEAVRSGIDDIRYIDALKTVSRELKDARVGKSLTDYADSLLAGIAQKPMVALNPNQIQSLRRIIATQTVKMRAVLAKAH